VAKSKDAYEVTLTDVQRQELALWLSDQIQLGLNARSVSEADVEYCWKLYEQARTRQSKRPDAADLTSYIPSEQVNSIAARIMRTVFTEPIWNVEGWGDAANRAPFVEEFHQWKAKEERLEGIIDKLVLQALVEPRGLLEIAEGSERRMTRKTIKAKVQTDPLTGHQLFGEDGQPVLVSNDVGDFEEAGPDEFGVETVIDSPDRVRTGPVYRLLPYRDSLILPGHARDDDEIFAYGKRLWRRYEDLHAKASGSSPLYDKEAVEKLRGSQDKETTPPLQRAGMGVAPQDGPQADVELWEVLVLVDLDQLMDGRQQGRVKKELRGARWYLITIHLGTTQILRVQFDDFERARYVKVILFPRVDRVTEGYSFVGHQLITVTEAHSAFLNLTADGAVMTLNRPIKRLTGALWDPDEQPWGAGAVIDVRSMQEVEPLDIGDVSGPGLAFIEMQERTAQRIGGINDIASGQVTQQDRTLGEVQMATEQSFVRMDLITRRFQQQGMEDIAQIRHAIWQRVIAEQQQGVDVPQSLLQSLEGRGVDILTMMPDKKATADMLEGAFQFTPHGSVQTADRNAQKQNTVALLEVIPKAMAAFPLLAPMFSTPQAARAIGRMIARDFGQENQQAFIGSPAQDLQITSQAQAFTMLAQLMQLQGMPGLPPPGGPMGAPPMGGPPGPPPMGGPPPGPPGPPTA
jgi:hypothetical protein